MDRFESNISPDSIVQLRSVVQPPEIRGRKNAEHWTASLYLRHISVYFTWFLLKTSITANGVTVLMIFTGWFTAAALLIPGIFGALLALVLGQLQMLIDCCDGEVARWKNIKSASGIFLDSVGHYSTEALIALALGIRAAAYPFDRSEDFLWTTLAGIFALCIVLNKALNDMARNARVRAGFAPLSDTQNDSVAPTTRRLASLYTVARKVPFYRLFHSVEMTIIICIFASLGALFSISNIDRILLVSLLFLCCLTLGGHFIAIISSRRLKP